jgi:hypothetical protein
MNVRKHASYPMWSVILTVLALFSAAPPILAQEEEPNNACGTATDLGPVALPLSMSRELAPPAPMQGAMSISIDSKPRRGRPSRLIFKGSPAETGPSTIPSSGYSIATVC